MTTALASTNEHAHKINVDTTTKLPLFKTNGTIEKHLILLSPECNTVVGLTRVWSK
jgi:hypothetical protein